MGGSEAQIGPLMEGGSFFSQAQPSLLSTIGSSFSSAMPYAQAGMQIYDLLSPQGPVAQGNIGGTGKAISGLMGNPLFKTTQEKANMPDGPRFSDLLPEVQAELLKALQGIGR